MAYSASTMEFISSSFRVVGPLPNRRPSRIRSQKTKIVMFRRDRKYQLRQARATLALVFLIASSTLDARTVLTLREDRLNLPARSMEYLEDAGHSLSIDDVSAASMDDRFRPVTAEVPNFGFSTSAYWLRFDVRNDSPESRWFLQVKYSPLDDIVFYQRATAEHPWERYQTGDRHLFSQ